MANATNAQDRLAALGAHLSARRFDVELTARGLRVADPRVPRARDGGAAIDLITCRERPEDASVLWFYFWGEPIAEADQVVDAAVTVVGKLSRRQVEGADR